MNTKSISHPAQRLNKYLRLARTASNGIHLGRGDATHLREVMLDIVDNIDRAEGRIPQQRNNV